MVCISVLPQGIYRILCEACGFINIQFEVRVNGYQANVITFYFIRMNMYMNAISMHLSLLFGYIIFND
jgi:hypothetical protein